MRLLDQWHAVCHDRHPVQDLRLTLDAELAMIHINVGGNRASRACFRALWASQSEQIGVQVPPLAFPELPFFSEPTEADARAVRPVTAAVSPSLSRPAAVG